MTTKESILAVLEEIPEQELPKVLAFVTKLKQTGTASPKQAQAEIDAEFLSIYNSVAEQRQEVFQRLADS